MSMSISHFVRYHLYLARTRFPTAICMASPFTAALKQHKDTFCNHAFFHISIFCQTHTFIREDVLKNIQMDVLSYLHVFLLGSFGVASRGM